VSRDRAPDVEELRAFCAAADAGGIGRAAVRLHISQPAVSKRLRHLEETVGVQLLERSANGVKLTSAGRRLYEEAQRALHALDRVSEVVSRMEGSGGRVRMAVSHSALASFVSELLGEMSDSHVAVEVVAANSSAVRDMVADGRAELGVAASRPNHTPYPGVRERPVMPDEVVLAVPAAHPWASRDEVSLREFLQTRLVLRDAGSNSRWTVDAVLREQELELAEPLVEVGTPQAARREARRRRAPALLSRAVVQGHGFHPLRITGLAFPREFVIVLPAIGEPTDNVAALVDLLVAGAAHKREALHA
jgi:DNA-binding transcriptional LysR family regulator